MGRQAVRLNVIRNSLGLQLQLVQRRLLHQLEESVLLKMGIFVAFSEYAYELYKRIFFTFQKNYPSLTTYILMKEDCIFAKLTFIKVSGHL